ncbi:MAG: hypothetical protein HOW73_48195 [Polyangiaceae bacterium]|nr:hypothetical protein [Polyangiaceae bacterium]
MIGRICFAADGGRAGWLAVWVLVFGWGVACNGIWGLDPVELGANGGGGSAAGGEGAGAAPDGGGGGDPSTGGGGSMQSGEHMCHDPGFSEGVVYDGSCEEGWYYANWENFGELCQGSYYCRIDGYGPPREAKHASAEGEPGPFRKAPCASWSIAARDPLGKLPRFWLTFDVPGTPAKAFNMLTPAEGIEVGHADWRFYEGICRVRLPDDISGYAEVGSWADGGDVLLDAFAIHAVACDDGVPECGM